MLRMSRLADYGSLLLTYMARNRDGHTANSLAADTGVPLPTVSKILKMLAKAGIVQSQRGVNGGYRLARDPEVITLTEILRALDGPIALTECGSTAECSCQLEPACQTQSHWKRINDAFVQVLGGVTLKELSQPAQERHALGRKA